MPRRPGWRAGLTLLALLIGVLPAAAQTPVGATILVDPTAEDGQDVEISADADGNFVVVFEVPDGTPADPRDSFARFYAQDGVPRGAVIPLGDAAPFQAGDQHSPVASHSLSGAAVVAWVDGDEQGVFHTAIRAQRFTPQGTTVGAEFTLAHGARLLEPTLLHVPNGGYFAAWTDVTNGLARMRHFVGTSAQGAIITIGVGTEPALSVAPDGTLAATFLSANDVYVRRFDSVGVPLGAAVLVGAAPATPFPDVRHARVAHASDGTFAVVWHSGDHLSPEPDVLLRRFSATGAPLGAAITVNTTTTGSQRYPDIAHHGREGFVVTWCRSAFDMRGRLFDESGAGVGSEFQVDFGTIGLQACGAVDAFRGRFVAAWPSEGPFGFYAQRFSTPSKVPSLAGPGAAFLALALCGLGAARSSARRSRRR